MTLPRQGEKRSIILEHQGQQAVRAVKTEGVDGMIPKSKEEAVKTVREKARENMLKYGS